MAQVVGKTFRVLGRIVKRAGMTTSIQTDIPYNPNRIYRLVGRDLYSAPPG